MASLNNFFLTLLNHIKIEYWNSKEMILYTLITLYFIKLNWIRYFSPAVVVTNKCFTEIKSDITITKIKSHIISFLKGT